MLMRPIALAFVTLVLLVPSAADAARDDTFCVRASKSLKGGELNSRIVAGKVKVRPVRMSQCVPEPLPPGAFFDAAIMHSSSITAGLEDFDAAFDGFDVEAMTVALAEIVKGSSSLDDWLRGRAPMECYLELYADWASMASELHAAAVVFQNGLLESDEPSMLQMRRPGLVVPGNVFASSSSTLIDQARDVFRECFEPS